VTQMELPIDEEHEIEIVRHVLEGDVQAFELLVLRYQKPIYNLAFRATASEDSAADLTQEAFAKAYERLERFDRSKRFFPWLYTIAVNVVRDHLRKLGRDRTVGVTDAQAAVEAAEAALAAAEESEDPAAIAEAQAALDAATQGLVDARTNLDTVRTEADQAIADAASASPEDIAGMREEGMGWGEIAHELGVHPSVLGLGHQKMKGNLNRVTEMAGTGPGLGKGKTKRNVQDGVAETPGSANAKGKGKALGLGKASSKSKSGAKGSKSSSNSGNSGGNGKSQGQSNSGGNGKGKGNGKNK